MAKEMKTEMRLLIPSHEVMNNFCYSYCKALFVKLVKLTDENRIFDDKTKALDKPDCGTRTSKIAQIVMSELGCQMKMSFPYTFNGVQETIRVVKEFLAIFEV